MTRTTPLLRRFAPLAAGLACLVLTPTGRGAPPDVDYAQTVTQLKQLVEAELKRGILTGVSVALIDDQRTVFAEGFGWADEASRRPATRRPIDTTTPRNRFRTRTSAATTR